MYWDDLTEDQQRAVGCTARRVLVLGGAGTGKTTVALWCARQFLKSSHAKDCHRVLFLTFSRTAVREISRRSGRALADVRDRVEVQTFHSFANRVITSFGRYVGLGKNLLPLQSKAEAKLLGRFNGRIGYDDLLPLALKAIRTPRVKQLLSKRWPLVVCDEFQDTDEIQWELLSELSEASRMVLLADPNQMIYDGFLGHRGVGPKRVEQALKLADLIVDLGTPSHRDPTNVIPAMAAAVRKRQFDHPAVRMAFAQDRLRIHTPVFDEDLVSVLRAEIETARQAGAQTIGIFGHGNQAVADLSADLISTGVDHVLVGLPEAHAEALAVLETLCLHGLGRVTMEEVRLRLAVFLTASVRGNEPPPLALALRGLAPLPGRLQERLAVASQALREAGGQALEDLVRTATEVWPLLGITAGRRPWNQSSRTFGAIAHQALVRSRGREEDFLADIARRVSEQRVESLLDLDVGAGHAIQLMNFHQTKGREADVVILVYRDADWFGREVEPFPQNSRLLYVSLTRARTRDVVILPQNPHSLVAPFTTLIGP